MISANHLASASNRLLGRLQLTTTVGLEPPPLANNMLRTEDLYMECDDEFLSDYQLVLRKQIEFFAAQQIDIDNFTPGRRKEISVGQVGIRCKHCAVLPCTERPRGTVYFPSTLPALYQAAQNMATIHFTDTCQQINPRLKEQLIDLHGKKAVSGHGGKKYWAEGAVARGICETERGLWFRDGCYNNVHPSPVTLCGANILSV
jgi:hypothetical protein